jgi:hypothetical protein
VPKYTRGINPILWVLRKGCICREFVLGSDKDLRIARRRRASFESGRSKYTKWRLANAWQAAAKENWPMNGRSEMKCTELTLPSADLTSICLLQLPSFHLYAFSVSTCFRHLSSLFPPFPFSVLLLLSGIFPWMRNVHVHYVARPSSHIPTTLLLQSTNRTCTRNVVCTTSHAILLVSNLKL